MLHKAIMFVVICNNKSQKLRPFPLQRMVAAVTRMYRIEKKKMDGSNLFPSDLLCFF